MGKRQYISLRVKLGIMVAVLLAAMAVFLLLFFPSRMNTLANTWVERRGTGMASVLASAIAPGLEFDDALGVEALLQQVAKSPAVAYLAALRADGSVLAAWNWDPARAPSLDMQPSSAPVVETAYGMMHVTTTVQARGGTTGKLIIGFSLEELETQRIDNLTTVAGASSILFVLGLMLSIGFGTLLVRPIQELTTITSNIVSRGDLTQKIDVHSNDEVGLLADSFRQMVAKLRSLPMTLNELVDGVLQVSEQLSKTSRTVASGASVVRAHVAETSTSMVEMLGALRGIAENVEVLHENAQRSAASNTQMVAVTTEVSRNVQDMVGSVESSSRAVEQMTTSIQEIARNISLLDSSLEETSSATTEMAASIEQVESNAKDTADLSARVSGDAESGVHALQETLGGINKIRHSSQTASWVIENLGARINDIGNILDVISEVANKTNLLALNAAIIAAQAGEHGRGFSVVADEIKALAQRTSASTKEIAEVIETIQRESENALSAMHEGSRNVDEGVKLGNQASGALKTIYESANRATNMVKFIAEAAVQQTQATKRVSTSVHQIAHTVQEINSASTEQARGCEQVLGLTHEMETMTTMVMRSIREQDEGSRQIAQSVDSINEMVSHVNTAQRAQTRNAEQALESVEKIKRVADEQSQSVRALEEAIGSLQERADMLRSAVQQFQV